MGEHWMLVAAAVAALVSIALVPPDEVYLTYFDWHTIGCLFCVLAVANAFRRIGAFDRIARSAIARNRNPRTLGIALIIAIRYFSLSRRVFPSLRSPEAPTMGRFLLTFAILNMGFFLCLLVLCQFLFTMP